MPYIPTSAYEPGFPIAWEGLDYESAKDATPRWYGVSSGNGNDGVSRMYPDYYVRTVDPYSLAFWAICLSMKDDYQMWAAENVEVDGEADYGISATLYDPPDDEIDHSECEDGEECTGCRECEDGNWSSHNGAWLIYEICPVDLADMQASRIDDMNWFDSLVEAFGQADVERFENI